MTLVGDSNICTVGDVSSRVFDAINVEDRNSMMQGLKGKLLFFDLGLVDKNDVCTTV